MVDIFKNISFISERFSEKNWSWVMIWAIVIFNAKLNLLKIFFFTVGINSYTIKGFLHYFCPQNPFSERYGLLGLIFARIIYILKKKRKIQRVYSPLLHHSNVFNLRNSQILCLQTYVHVFVTGEDDGNIYFLNFYFFILFLRVKET